MSEKITFNVNNADASNATIDTFNLFDVAWMCRRWSEGKYVNGMTDELAVNMYKALVDKRNSLLNNTYSDEAIKQINAVVIEELDKTIAAMDTRRAIQS